MIKQYQYLTKRFPFIKLLWIAFWSWSPVIIGLIGAYFWEIYTQAHCNEGNCPWAMIAMFGIITVPLGMLLFLFTASDLFWQWRSRRKNKTDQQ